LPLCPYLDRHRCLLQMDGTPVLPQ
jgi:hypothetical protein